MFYFTVLLLLQAAPFIYGYDGGRMALIEFKNDHYGMINVGQNNQLLYTLFDTGSNHVWVVSDKNPVGPVVGVNIPFKTSTSTSFGDTGIHYEEKFSTGTISGFRGIDKIVLKAIPGYIELDKFEFGVVESISNDLKEKIFYLHCALFGLNLVSTDLLPNEPTPSLDILAKEAPVFGFYYHSNQHRLVFGQDGKDVYGQSYITSPLSSHNVVKIGDKYNGWNVKITKFQVANLAESKSFTAERIRFGQVITRSGVVLTGPKTLFLEIVNYIYKLGSVEGFDPENLISFECDSDTYIKTVSKLPIVSVFIDDIKMDIEPTYYFQRLKNGPIIKCYCLLAPADIDYVIIGNGFIKKYYTEFDYNKKQVSFALAKH